MRSSRSNSDGSVGKLRADPALSGLGEGIVRGDMSELLSRDVTSDASKAKSWWGIVVGICRKLGASTMGRFLM